MLTVCASFVTRTSSTQPRRKSCIGTFEVVGFLGKSLLERESLFASDNTIARNVWYPDGLTLLRGRDHTKKATALSRHALGEKTIADVCEALIGASLLSGAPDHRFDMAVKAVTAVVNSPSHNVSCWKDYYALYSLPKYQVMSPDGFELDLARKIEEKLGYRFKYPRLLRSAFTHPSYPSAWGKNVPCYQRLEFLGDALLDMVCIEDLFARFPDRDPQWLTEHKVGLRRIASV